MSTKTLIGLHKSYKEKGSQRTIWLEVGVARVGALGPNMTVDTLLHSRDSFVGLPFLAILFSISTKKLCRTLSSEILSIFNYSAHPHPLGKAERGFL